MLGLATKPVKLTVLAPVAELEAAETKQGASCESMSKYGVHPVHEADESKNAHGYENYPANLHLIHKSIIAKTAQKGSVLC